MQELIIRLREVLAQAPTVFAASAAVAILIASVLIAGVAIYIAYLFSPRGRVAALEVQRTAKTARGRIDSFIVALTVALLVGGVTYYAQRPDSCRSCHQEKPYSEGLEKSVHAAVGCMECHGAVGATAWADNTIEYAGWLWAQYGQAAPAQAGSGASVEPRKCLSCHEDVSNGVKVAKGVRVQHSDFLDQGYVCTVCHGDTAHSAPQGAAAQSVMNQCLRCHDGEKVTGACETCHADDHGIRAVAARGGRMATVGIRSSGNCYGCHNETPCLRCHGVTMPHPPDWNPQNLPRNESTGKVAMQVVGNGIDPGQHARAGFANRDVCWRCHHKPGEIFKPSDESCHCHNLYGYMHGGPAWIKEHGLQATGVKGGVNSGCDGCHGPPELFCGFCHPPSYAQRYKPIPGADNYSASPGWPRSDTFSR